MAHVEILTDSGIIIAPIVGSDCHQLDLDYITSQAELIPGFISVSAIAT